MDERCGSREAMYGRVIDRWLLEQLQHSLMKLSRKREDGHGRKISDLRKR